MATIESKKLKNFLVDVDGVLTTGQFHYTSKGKTVKIFGADDNDALGLLKPFLNIEMVSGDKRGFPISKKRVQDDMKFPIHLVSTADRLNWIEKHFNLSETIYMGDGIFDAIVFAKVAYSIAPANSFFKIKDFANFVTKAKGGEGAVAEACWHLLEKFFGGADIQNLTIKPNQGISSK